MYCPNTSLGMYWDNISLLFNGHMDIWRSIFPCCIAGTKKYCPREVNKILYNPGPGVKYVFLGRQEHQAQAVFNHTEDYVLFPDEATTSLCCWDARNASRKQLLSLGKSRTAYQNTTLAGLFRYKKLPLQFNSKLKGFFLNLRGLRNFSFNFFKKWCYQEIGRFGNVPKIS